MCTLPSLCTNHGICRAKTLTKISGVSMLGQILQLTVPSFHNHPMPVLQWEEISHPCRSRLSSRGHEVSNGVYSTASHHRDKYRHGIISIKQHWATSLAHHGLRWHVQNAPSSRGTEWILLEILEKWNGNASGRQLTVRYSMTNQGLCHVSGRGCFHNWRIYTSWRQCKS